MMRATFQFGYPKFFHAVAQVHIRLLSTCSPTSDRWTPSALGLHARASSRTTPPKLPQTRVSQGNGNEDAWYLAQLREYLRIIFHLFHMETGWKHNHNTCLIYHYQCRIL